MPDPDFPILPTTKVAALLDRYPQLEDVLISLAPPFKKLKNPFLRKGVARVASLRQAAAVGGLSATALVNALRAAVGQSPLSPDTADERAAYFSSQPHWFDATRIVHSINESQADPDNKCPSSPSSSAPPLFTLARSSNSSPATSRPPGIDILKQKGYRVWSSQMTPGEIRTYVSRP